LTILTSGWPTVYSTVARFPPSATVLFGSVADGSELALFVENHVVPLTKHSFEVQRTELRVALRSAISLFPADGQSPDVLIDNAETTLRSAKTAGVSHPGARRDGLIVEVARHAGRRTTIIDEMSAWR
jgi:hypothetical protein